MAEFQDFQSRNPAILQSCNPAILQCYRLRDVALETIANLRSIVRPLRSTLRVAVDPIRESETRRRNCDGSSIGVPLNPTITSPALMPAS